MNRFLSTAVQSKPSRNIKNHYKVPSITSDFKIQRIPTVNHTTNLVASIEFSGFMPDHLDFISCLAKIISLKSGIATSPVISKPIETTKVNTLVSPFVHSKTKNVFEEKKHVRVLQVYDTHLDNVEGMVNSLISIMPPGINLLVEKFEMKSIGEIKPINQSPRKDSFEDLVEKKMKEYIHEFQEKK